VTAGNVLGLGVGGNIAATYGWRQAFLIAALPGLLVALVVRLTLAEPRLQAGGADTPTQTERAADAIARLRQKRSYVTALFGSVLYFLFVYGPVIFIPSFLLRVLHEPLASASTTLAVVGATASSSGPRSVVGWQIG